ncbi:hypothetical protein Ctha_0167 [Chloroherpeton thalassium ATCC 35110]|uniref:Uncharacterized protein n=1 Tax=Chloroherpeton thalassium (strain ATCC 35110 / GB-78) TaxID=517418 RepID=B3QSZ5_CHLT3|nr:hypothetical protein [Chloroherpeton thalassium]ACF12638.1 hypothetical protein Ctha_0167 [Chloroherpeton thalassium ATCC 35110]
MTGKIAKRNEKILQNIELDNFDFLEIPELYIHSGELNKNEIEYIRARLEEMQRVRENCEPESLLRMRQANERAILNFLGEMRYRRLQLRMQMYLKEYCEKFIESYDKDIVKPEKEPLGSVAQKFHLALKDLWQKVCTLFSPYH